LSARRRIGSGRGVKRHNCAFRIGAVLSEPGLKTIWFVFALTTVAAVFVCYGLSARAGGRPQVAE
jgi:hypothetical protein